MNYTVKLNGEIDPYNEQIKGSIKIWNDLYHMPRIFSFLFKDGRIAVRNNPNVHKIVFKNRFVYAIKDLDSYDYFFINVESENDFEKFLEDCVEAHSTRLRPEDYIELGFRKHEFMIKQTLFSELEAGLPGEVLEVNQEIPNYESYFKAAYHNSVPFGVACGLLQDLHNIRDNKDENLFIQRMMEYHYELPGSVELSPEIWRRNNLPQVISSLQALDHLKKKIPSNVHEYVSSILEEVAERYETYVFTDNSIVDMYCQYKHTPAFGHFINFLLELKGITHSDRKVNCEKMKGSLEALVLWLDPKQ